MPRMKILNSVERSGQARGIPKSDGSWVGCRLGARQPVGRIRSVGGEIQRFGRNQAPKTDRLTGWSPVGAAELIESLGPLAIDDIPVGHYVPLLEFNLPLKNGSNRLFLLAVTL